MTLFKFEHPPFLWLLLAVPALILLGLWYRFWSARALARLGAVERLLMIPSRGRFWWKTMLLASVAALLPIVLANPQRGAKKQSVAQESSDVFIALDISQSMLAEDVKPNRLELAKVFAQKLVQSLEGERIGLIFFAGDAYLQMPLSTDYSFTLQSLQSADPTLISEQGTAIPAAIELAQKSFNAHTGGGRAIIILTDGENHDDNAISQASDAFGDGVVVYAVGVGTTTGAPIPTGNPGASQYKRDEQGSVVRTRLDELALGRIALAGGGRAYNVGQGDGAVRSLKNEVALLQKREIEVRSFTEMESYFQWFLLPAFLLLLLEFWIGKRRFLHFILLFTLLLPESASAQSPHRSLRSGDREYDQERYHEAEQNYRNATDRDPSNLTAIYNYGNALYQQGKYPEAAQQFQKAAQADPKNADARHNLGNALLKQHKYKEAAEAYEQSLRLRPGDPETKMNLQMAKKKIEEERQQQQQQNQQQQNQQQQNQQGQQPQPTPPNAPQNQQQQPPSQNQPQQGPSNSTPPKEPPPQTPPPADGSIKPEQARRMLETAISAEDRKNAKKYREAQRSAKPKTNKKDW